MAVRLLNPDDHVTIPLHHHVATATGNTQIHAGVEQASREFDLPRPPLAAIGVDILFEEGILVEAEVTAVVDRPDPGVRPVPGTPR